MGPLMHLSGGARANHNPQLFHAYFFGGSPQEQRARAIRRLIPEATPMTTVAMGNG